MFEGQGWQKLKGHHKGGISPVMISESFDTLEFWITNSSGALDKSTDTTLFSIQHSYYTSSRQLA